MGSLEDAIRAAVAVSLVSDSKPHGYRDMVFDAIRVASGFDPPGISSSEIASALGLNTNTVRHHVMDLFREGAVEENPGNPLLMPRLGGGQVRVTRVVERKGPPA